MKKQVCILVVCLFSFVSMSSQVYRTEALSSEIHTIEVTRNDNWMLSPILELNSQDFVQLSFDRISENSFDRLRYKIIHCNMDWKQSSLSDIEYLDGFNDNWIEDYASSTNTTVEYTNFRLTIPNKDVQLKVSGNYIIQVYDGDDAEKVLLNASFSVLDSQIGIVANVSSNTLIDVNKAHQQVSFSLMYNDIKINDPYSDLKVLVRQNDRLDNQKENVKPSIVQPNKLVYEQNRDLIFEAGNEFRRFDMPSYRYNGLNVMNMAYENPYYRASLIPGKIRANLRYIYDEDQNGRNFTRNAEGRDSSIDADYFFVDFTLEADEPFAEKIYINSNFTHHKLGSAYLMKYDYDKRVYSASLFLKQGVYNYQYLSDFGNRFSTSLIEGNYYETENEYSILVYHRPIGQRYDSLIGYLRIGK